MKQEVNLLSPEAIAERMKRIQHKRILTLLSAMLGSLLLILAAYGSTLSVNTVVRNSLNDKLVSQGKDRTDTEQSIRVLNAKLATMNSRITAHPRWMVHVQDVLRAVPVGMLITKFELLEDPSVLQVTGKSASGALAVEYRKSLEALPWVDHVEAPLQNFARSSESIVTFSIFRKEDAPSATDATPAPKASTGNL